MVRKYIIFASISTLLNILSQFITLQIYKGFLSLYIAIFVGTLVGLITKYILDKKFIFYFKPLDKKKDLITFFTYTFTGIFTTLLFWAVEISFEVIFGGQVAKDIGARIGLSIGYFIKYHLDKKFVFKQQQL